MKVRHRILYYLTVILIVLVAGYGFFKRVFVSQKIRIVITERLQPQLKADEFDISSLDMKIDKIFVKDIHYKKDNLDIKINEIEIDYSFFKLLSKGINFKEWVENIHIKTVNLEIDRSYETSKDLDWNFNIDQYRSILNPLKNYSYLDTIKVNNINFNLRSRQNHEISVFQNLSGGLMFDSKDGLNIYLDGKLLKSEEKNVFLKGKLNYTSLNSEFDLDIKRSRIPVLQGIVGEYKTDFGYYEGKLNLEINKYGKNQIFLFGDFRVNDFAGDILDKMRLSNVNLLLSYYNGSLFLNEFNGYVDRIPFQAEGMIYNLLNPQGDIYLSFMDLGDKQIKSTVFKFIDNKKLFYNMNFFNNNILTMHFNVKNNLVKTNADILCPKFKFKDRVMEDIKLNVELNLDRIDIKKCSFFTDQNAVNLSGKYFFNQNNEFEGDFSATGTIFSQIPFLKKTEIKKLPTILKGKIRGTSLDDYQLEARLEAFNFKKGEDEILFYSNFDISEGILMFDINNYADINIGDGFYNLNSEDYRFKGQNLLEPVKLLYGNTFVKESEIIKFDLNGNKGKLNIHASSKDPNSLFFGELDAKFNINNNVAETFVNWAPDPSNNFSRPANFRLNISEGKITASDIFIDYKPVSGSAWVNLGSEEIGGELNSRGLELGSVLGFREFSTNTDIHLNISGYTHSPYIDLYLTENEFMYFPGDGFESIRLKGEIEAHLEDNKIRIEKVIIYDDFGIKICTLTGRLKNFKEYSLNTYGEINMSMFSSIIGKNTLKGKLKYKLDSEGTIENPKLNKCVLDLKNAAFNKDYIDKLKIILTGSGYKGFYLELLQLDVKKYLNLSAAGFVPYNKDQNMQITGYFNGNILGYLDSKFKLVENAYSANEGSFIIGGNIFKPRIDDLEIYFLDGWMGFKDITSKLENIKSKINIKNGKDIDIAGLSLNCSDTGSKVYINNGHRTSGFSDIMIPGGFNLGFFELKFPDGGISGRIPGIMQQDSYGTIRLSGFDNDKFIVSKTSDGISLSGKVELRNSAIAFPLNTPEGKAGNSDNVFMRTVSLDLDVIPKAGNIYYFNNSTSEVSFWDKIKSTFTKFDNELSDVKIPIQGSNNGLKIKGALKDPKKLQLNGEVNGINGSCNYSAFSFKIDEASIAFDETRNKNKIIDPYLKAIGKTVVKTKLDSTGFSGYENIYIKIVTKDDGEIVDQEGGRISGFSIVLLDENGNPWLDDDEKFSELDTRGTAREMFNEALDTRLLSPFINPIENAIGKLLGAQVSIRPNITSNITQERPSGTFIPSSYAGYFVGSEFYISKFLTDDLAMTWHSKYIGSEEYTEVVEQTYGYKNNMGFDYRLTNYLLTSAGYQFDTLNETSGYNVGLSFRYRFKNISQPVNYIKNLFRK